MKSKENLSFAVIGLGAFGSTLAHTLAEEGAHVIAVDNNMDHLDELKDKVTDTICFDATDPELLREHGITEVDVGVVAIGEDFKPVVLVAMELLSAGVKEVYGRAGSVTEEKILNRIGITDVIHPERQVAERMGVSLLRRGMRNIFEIGSELAVFEVEAPEAFAGYSLEELKLRSRFEINLITIKRKVEEPEGTDKKSADETEEEELRDDENYEPIGVVTASTVIKRNDQLLLVGTKENVDKMLEVSG